MQAPPGELLGASASVSQSSDLVASPIAEPHTVSPTGDPTSEGGQRSERMEELWHLFLTKARWGQVSGDDARELVMSYDKMFRKRKQAIQELLPEGKSFEFENIVHAIDELENRGDAKDSEGAGAGGQSVEEEKRLRSRDVAAVGICEYISSACSGNVGRVTLSWLQPREFLKIASSVMVVLVALVAFLAVSVMWAKRAELREESALSSLGDTMSGVADGIENAHVEVGGEDMRDSARTLLHWLESRRAVGEKHVHGNTLRTAAVAIHTTGALVDHVLFPVTVRQSQWRAKFMESYSGIVGKRAWNDTNASVRVAASLASLWDAKEVNATTYCIPAAAESPYCFGVPRSDLAAAALKVFSLAQPLKGALPSAGLVASVVPYLFRWKMFPEGLPARDCPDASNPDVCALIGVVNFSCKEPSTYRPITMLTSDKIVAVFPAFIYPLGSVYAASYLKISDFTSLYRQRLVGNANDVNQAMPASHEVVLAFMNETTKRVIPQMNPFKNSDCLGVCSRDPPSDRLALTAINSQGLGWGVSLDYRPSPVVGGYAYIGGQVTGALLLERDIIDIRKKSLTRLLEIAEKMPFQVRIFAFDNAPTSAYYFSDEPCPARTDCRTVAPYGIVVQFGCQHCQRVATRSALQTIHEDTLGDGWKNVSDELAGTLRPVLQQKTTKVVFERDFMYYTFIENVSVAIEVVATRGEHIDVVSGRILIGAAITLAIVAVGVLCMVAVSHLSMATVERQWAARRAELEESKCAQDNHMKELVPAALVAAVITLPRGTIIAEHYSQACIVATDCCGFTDLTRGWAYRRVLLTVAYMVDLQRQAAVLFGLTNLHSIGDSMWSVALEDDDAHGSLGERAVGYTVAVHDLFSSLFVHAPQSCAKWSTHFSDSGVADTVELPSVRSGIHLGSIATGLFDVEKLHPKFDCYGPTLHIAGKLAAAAEKHRIYLSSAVRDNVSFECRKYSYGPVKKLPTRYGPIVSFPLASALQDFAVGVIASLGIREAVTPFPLDPTVQVKYNLFAAENTQDRY